MDSALHVRLSCVGYGGTRGLEGVDALMRVKTTLRSFLMRNGKITFLILSPWLPQPFLISANIKCDSRRV